MKKTPSHIFPAIILTILVSGAFVTAWPAAKTSGLVMVHAGKFLDVRSGKTLNDQAIVIDGGKIVSVGPFAQATRSAGDRLIDLGSATVLPGLTDAHTHMTGDPQDVGYEGLGISLPRSPLIGARNARLTLEAGFTTVRNAGADGSCDVALRGAATPGHRPGPPILPSTP